MDENKIVKLFKFIDEKKEKPQLSQASPFSTNPIVQRMLLFNIQSKKNKFKFKDLFS